MVPRQRFLNFSIQVKGFINFVGRLGSHLDRLSENASFHKFTYNYRSNTIAMVKMDDIIMSKNDNYKPKPH